MQKTDSYLKFLEIINQADNSKDLLKEAFYFIKKEFSAERVQLYKFLKGFKQMSVDYEITDDSSMLGIRIELFNNSLKKNLESQEVKDKALLRCGVKSLFAVEFNLLEEVDNLIVLTFSEIGKKLSTSEKDLFVKIVSSLQKSYLRLTNLNNYILSTKTLQEQNSRLIEIDNSKTTFLNNIVHEMRTPLTTILGLSKALILNSSIQSSDDKSSLEQIYKAANRVSSNISDLLQIKNLNTFTWIPKAESCDVKELVEGCIGEFLALNKDCNISIEIENDFQVVQIDSKLLRQILDNLISNAIKYSLENCTITVLLGLGKDEFILKIKDSGIGITKEELSKIFDKHYRSKNPKVQSVQGAGLGLSICKEIVEVLGGKIKAESEVNKGSTFTVSLPVRAP